MRYVPNPGATDAHEQTPEFKAGMHETAVGVAEAIKVAAEPFRKTGYFIRHVVPRGDKVRLRDSFAHLVEFGSRNNPPQANVRRGVVAAGLKFRDDGAHRAD